jgi:hypothetical protein
MLRRRRKVAGAFTWVQAPASTIANTTIDSSSTRNVDLHRVLTGELTRAFADEPHPR